jgi:alanyl-tRNA synthetase
VFEDRPVTVRYGTAEEFSKLGVRKEVERSGILRAVEIESVELQPCGGTHVKSTGQIGMILVRRCTKIRQDWRVEFVCGGRAEKVARRDFELLGEAAEKLGCASEDIVSAASRALSELDVNFKNLRTTLERLAAAEAAAALQSAAAGPDGIRVVLRVFEDVPVEYLGFFATELARAEKTVALLAEKNSGQLLFAQHASSGKDMNTLLKRVLEKFGGKGGGTRDFARGKVADAAQVRATVDAAQALIRAN